MRQRAIAHAIVSSCGLCALLALGSAVHGQGGAPIAAPDGAYVVLQGGTLTRAAPGVLANDTGNAALSAVLSQDVLHGALSLAADGSFTYAHDGGAATTDRFRYHASDGVLASSETTATLAVTGPVGATLEVPADHETVQDAIDAADSGDLILIAPGTYRETIELTKAVTLASWFLTTGDASYIDTTILDGRDRAAAIELPASAEDGASIIGLTIQNAEDGISARAKFHILRSRIRWTKDGIDYEGGGGGTARYSVFEENEDDGIDPDGDVDVLIEHNLIRNNGGDGIEVRLQPYSGPTLQYVIRHNRIFGNQEDGIQLIDYDVLTDRHFEISYNAIYDNVQAGLGMMSGANTQENYEGASIAERILVIGNTFSGNNHGMTGGDNAVVLNNLFVGHPVLAVKNVDGASELAFNLFHDNGAISSNANLDPATTYAGDPLLDPQLRLLTGSPAIDAGTAFYVFQGDTVIDLEASAYEGPAPDLGAFEWLPGSGSGPDAPDLSTPQEGAVDLPLTPTLRWQGSAETFQVQIATSSDFLSSQTVYHVSAGPALEHSVASGVLDHVRTYFWRVRGAESGATGAWSQVRSFTTEAPTGPPEAPTFSEPLPGVAGVELEPTLGWRGAADLFTVQIATDSTFTAPILETTTTAKSLVLGAGTLAHATTYYWRVRGENVFGSSPWSAAFSFTTMQPPSPLQPPWGLHSPTQDLDSIDLRWEEPTDARVTAYAIYRDDVRIATESEPDHLAVGLAPDTLYAFRVASIGVNGDESLPSAELSVWTTSGPPTIALDIPVTHSVDDAEERASGSASVTTSSTALELTEDGARLQLVGVRFRNVDVPGDTPILGARIQFTAAASHSTSTDLLIEGEDADDAGAFQQKKRNLSDRPPTGQSVSWDPPVWGSGDSGADERTPELTSIVQEIVDRPGWSAGNAMAFLISGSGQRVAYAYDGDPDRSAALEIEYLTTCSVDADGDGFACELDCDDDDDSIHPDADEICDGRDNDCDGSVDEHDAVDASLWYADFDGDGYGDPASTTVACTQPTGWLADTSDCNDADPAAFPGASEACNGRDDDCDGSVDGDGACGALTLSIPIAAGDDDVEERISLGGAMSMGGSTLQLVEDGTRQQAVGLRFRNVGLPQGATIVSARIQFDTDEIDTTSTNLVIEGEASDDAPVFERQDGNVTDRPRTGQAVPWTPDPWTSSRGSGPEQRTPELAALVQEIVDRSGWSEGNALVFIVTGSGTRSARSYDGTPSRAAVLELEYAEGGGGCTADADGDGFPCEVDCNDADPSVHPGVTDLCNGIDDDCDGSFDEDFASQSCATGQPGICAAGSTSCQAGAPLCEPDLQPQAEICSDGLDNDCDGDTDQDDASCGAPVSLSIPITAGHDDAEERTSSGGSMSMGSSSLQLVEDGSLDQAVGLRFRNVGLPQGATVVSARIQFNADESDSTSTSLVLQAQDSDDAPVFEREDGNITDRPRTSQSVTWTPDPWTGAHGSGPEQRTPELAALVQEVVSRPGWSEGNALAFIVTGSGTRTARSYDGTPSRAAVLELEYTQGGGGCTADADGDGFPCEVDCNDADPSVYPGAAEICDDGLDNDCDGDTDLDDVGSCSPLELSVQVTAGSDDAEERVSSGGSMSMGSSSLQLAEDGSLDQAVGLRFRNLGLPQGATILGARVQFSSDEIDTGSADLVIEGQASDDAATFERVDGNVTDRPRTSASVFWDPPAWTSSKASGADQRTPELTAIVQEIVDRPGWSDGNALVLIVTGSGTRTARSYDGTPARAAILEVEYLAAP
jgi:hypothetical protein